MAEQTRITATITFLVVTEDDEGLDAVCEDAHTLFGALMTEQDWPGIVELSWSPAPAPGGPTTT